MTVIGAEAVDAARSAGILAVGPRDVVTPLARERARERGVQIVVATPGTTAAVSGDRRHPVPPHPAAAPAPPPVRPPSGALFRRGAPLPRAVRPGAVRRAVVVGAGDVGPVTAMRLAEADVFGEVVLVDGDEARARAVALDLGETAVLGGSATRVRGCATVEEAGPADYVVLTVSTGDVTARVGRTSPDAVLVLPGPVDGTVPGFPAERVRAGAAGPGTGAVLARATAVASTVLAMLRRR